MANPISPYVCLHRQAVDNARFTKEIYSKVVLAMRV